MDSLIIIGASGHGRVVADIAQLSGRYKRIFFLDDADLKYSGKIKVIGKINDVDKWIKESEIFIAIGDNLCREQLTFLLESKYAQFATLIHPSAVIASDVKIAKGTVVMANAVINCGTIIGKSVIINTGATIDHDNVINNFVHVSPGVHIAGTVTIGEKTWIGIGTNIINNIRICAGCVIGAGTVVISDLINNGTYVGIPAKLIKK